MEDSIVIPTQNHGLGKTLLLPWRRTWYEVKAKYRQFRIMPAATNLLGSQYRRSRERIEIDITYLCNLRCQNCNRSISQAPEKLHISLDTIKQFVAESIERKKRWKVIRVLGGEPTLHPAFEQVIAELLKYRAWEPTCSIIVVSNGNSRPVNVALEKLPPEIEVENSAKTGNIQPAFGPFNDAPIDDPAFTHAEYRNGCDIMETCGMGLTPLGYYPCAIAGGIDRIAGKHLGYSTLPSDEDDMTKLCEEMCRLCGHFKEGHGMPPDLRAPLLTQETSVTWVKMFEDRKRHRRKSREQHAAIEANDSRAAPEKVCD